MLRQLPLLRRNRERPIAIRSRDYVKPALAWYLNHLTHLQRITRLLWLLGLRSHDSGLIWRRNGC